MNGPELAVAIAAGLLLIAGLLEFAVRMDRRENRLVALAEEIAYQEGIRRTLAGLVDVTPDGTLISPREVELELHDGWSYDDALDVLATIEAL